MENRLRSMYDQLNDLKNQLNTICSELDQMLYDYTEQSTVTWNDLKAQLQQEQEQRSYPSLEQLYNKRQAAQERYRIECELAHGPQLTNELAEDEIVGRN